MKKESVPALLLLIAIPAQAQGQSQEPESQEDDLRTAELRADFEEFQLEDDEDALLNRLRLNVFADLTLGTEWGGPADEDERALFDSFGVDDFPLNSFGKGFNIVGADFLATMDLTRDLVFQSEINFQVARGGTSEVEVDAERFFLDYRHSELVNVQAGLFFTPIGYHNRFLYSRAWLMHSVQVPDLFEEELNLVPTHTIGVNIHGRFQFIDQAFHYIVGVGNGRGVTPVENQFARDLSGKEITALLEWAVPGHEEFLVGVSGWFGEIDTFQVGAIGNTVDTTTASEVSLDERGLDSYITFFGKRFNLLTEFVYAEIEDDELTGGITELSLNFHDGKLHPYVRYDFTDLPSGDQGDYYGLRLDGTALTKNFIPEFQAAMVGVNYDVNPNTRLKLEFIHHLDGVRQENALVMQIAWGF